MREEWREEGRRTLEGFARRSEEVSVDRESGHDDGRWGLGSGVKRGWKGVWSGWGRI